MSTEPITFEVARAFRMFFGKYEGGRLDRIAEKDEGLLYLDWLRGELEVEQWRSTRRQVVLDHIVVYLGDPTIQLAVARAMRKRSAWREG